jgi:hypothetical protein
MPRYGSRSAAARCRASGWPAFWRTLSPGARSQPSWSSVLVAAPVLKNLPRTLEHGPADGGRDRRFVRPRVAAQRPVDKAAAIDAAGQRSADGDVSQNGLFLVQEELHLGEAPGRLDAVPRTVSDTMRVGGRRPALSPTGSTSDIAPSSFSAFSSWSHGLTRARSSTSWSTTPPATRQPRSSNGLHNTRGFISTSRPPAAAG